MSPAPKPPTPEPQEVLICDETEPLIGLECEESVNVQLHRAIIASDAILKIFQDSLDRILQIVDRFPEYPFAFRTVNTVLSRKQFLNFPSLETTLRFAMLDVVSDTEPEAREEDS
jgi:hypothetical protein